MPINLPQVSIPSWSQTKHASKQSFDKVYSVVDKLGAPINKLTNNIGSEAFWPTTLDKESDKAARILRSFCKDGFYVESDASGPNPEGPKGKTRSVQKIPSEVIKRAKGLAIFTTMRSGLWVSGAGGSGILVARKEDGDWSPPSGILLHTAGLGFLVGVDIYDCVVVINTDKALEAFTKIRCTLGGEVSAVAGPVGVGGVLETEIHKRQAPVWNYLKSRGFYAGVQIDGTVIIERGDENERFYGEKVAVRDILAGKVRHTPHEVSTLMATIKAAQGDKVDEAALPPSEPTPGDMEVERPETPVGFGLPAEDDPDPFGVKALEQEGMEIKEANTNVRPSLEAFEYKPSPSSPIYSTFRRWSVDSKKRDSKRSSIRSVTSVDRGIQTQDSDLSPSKQTPTKLPEDDVTGTKSEHAVSNSAIGGELGEATYEQEEGEPAPIITKARMVSIPKRVPPKLPPRNPNRSSASATDLPRSPGSAGRPDQATSPHVPSPLKDSSEPFQDIPLYERDSTPRGQDLDEGMQTIDLSSTQESFEPSSSGTGHLSPNASRDAFDGASVSGSKDLEDTATISKDTPITMQDNETDDHSAMKSNDEKAVDASDEFHSMPGTPVENTSSGSHGGKDDKHALY